MYPTACKIGKIKFTNNVWNAPVPLTFQDLKDINMSDSGAIVIKTTTLKPLKGNPNDYSIDEKGNSVNNIALHNNGIDAVITTIEKLQPIKPVFVSIFGTPFELIRIVEKLNQVKGDILIEWNISCPNVLFDISLHSTLPKLKELSLHPLGIKIGIGILPVISGFLEKHKVDFISMINTIKGKGGAQIKKDALKHIKSWAEKTTIPIIGMGGIQDGDDVEKFLQAGAVAVEIGTTFLRQGVNVFNNPSRLNLVPLLYDCNIIQKGSFPLKSGIISDFYIDFRKALSYPNLWADIIVQVLEKVRRLKFDAVCGVPYGALPLASIIALRCRKPLLLCRKTVKEHGKKKILEGDYKEGIKVLVVEDVMTTGSSIEQTISVLRNHKLSVDTVFVLANRSEKNYLMEEKKRGKNKVKVYPLFSLRDLKTVHMTYSSRRTRLTDVMNAKNTRLCFSADISDPEKLLEMVEKVAPYICMVKIHTDIFEQKLFCDGNWRDFKNKLQYLAMTKNFLLMADRKLTDIPSIVKKQCLKLREYLAFDFVTTNLLPGEEILDAIEECKLGAFVVAQMSSSHDWDPVYTKRCVQVAEQHPAAVGLICQEYLSDMLLNAVPGVGQGKNHRKKEKLDFADILIVGRSIYEAEDPVKVAKMYMD